MTVNAVRLNHAVLFVSDVDRSVHFYEQAFGMTVVAREPRPVERLDLAGEAEQWRGVRTAAELVPQGPR